MKINENKKMRYNMKNINQKEYKALLELGLIESIPKSQFDKIVITTWK